MTFASTSTCSNLRTQFVDAYQALEAVREKYTGVTVVDPQTGRNDPIETSAFIKRINDRYGEIVASPPVVKRRITDKLANLFRKDDDLLLHYLIKDMRNKKNLYEANTFIRSKYDLLTPIAFCRTDDLSKYLGPPRNDSVLHLVWFLQFQQLGIEGTKAGGLELLGISNKGLVLWWSDGQFDQLEQETQTWADLQNLAFK